MLSKFRLLWIFSWQYDLIKDNIADVELMMIISNTKQFI